MKLGKKPAAPDPRDITFAAVKPEVVKVPARFGHGSAFRNWQMLGNGPDDTVEAGFQGAGDCVLAGAGHETMLTLKLAGKTVNITGRESIEDYSAVTGYVIGDDSTDQGTDVHEALRYRRRTGIVDHAGHRHFVGAYVSINPKDWDELFQAVYTFSAVGIGFEFPASAMQQFDAGEAWDVVAGSPIEGGHYVPVVGRTSSTVGTCITWARKQPFTKAFYEKYNDEAWAIVYPEELKAGKTEHGMNLAQLNAALKTLH